MLQVADGVDDFSGFASEDFQLLHLQVFNVAFGVAKKLLKSLNFICAHQHSIDSQCQQIWLTC